MSHNTPSAVVLGNAHSFQGNELLHNKQSRDKALHDYAKNSIDTVTNIFNKYSMPLQQQAIACQLILDYFSLIDVIIVPNKRNPVPEKVISFHSPQVEQAMEGLKVKII